MLPEPQGPWLHPAATVECPGCGHIVDAERAVCEWCDTELSGEPGTPQGEESEPEAIPPGSAGPPMQPAPPVFLLAQPPRPTDPPTAAVPAFTAPEQIGPLPGHSPPPPLTALALVEKFGLTLDPDELLGTPGMPSSQSGDGKGPVWPL